MSWLSRAFAKDRAAASEPAKPAQTGPAKPAQKARAAATGRQRSNSPVAGQPKTHRHAIVQSEHTRYTIDVSRLRQTLEGSVAYVFDLEKEHIEQLLSTGRTEAVFSLTGQLRAVTLEYCDCPDMFSHRLGTGEDLLTIE